MYPKNKKTKKQKNYCISLPVYVYAGHVQHLVAHNGGFTVAGRWTLQHVDGVPEANEHALTPQVRLYLDQLVGLWRNVSTVSVKLCCLLHLLLAFLLGPIPTWSIFRRPMANIARFPSADWIGRKISNMFNTGCWPTIT